jgi:hypothetical protein
MSAVGDRRTASAPELRQGKAVVGVDQIWAGVAAGSCADEGVVGFAYAVSVIQFLPRQFLTGARVGGAVNGCHKVSRKWVRRGGPTERLF